MSGPPGANVVVVPDQGVDEIHKVGNHNVAYESGRGKILQANVQHNWSNVQEKSRKGEKAEDDRGGVKGLGIIGGDCDGRIGGIIDGRIDGKT